MPNLTHRLQGERCPRSLPRNRKGRTSRGSGGPGIGNFHDDDIQDDDDDEDDDYIQDAVDDGIEVTDDMKVSPLHVSNWPRQGGQVPDYPGRTGQY